MKEQEEKWCLPTLNTGIWGRKSSSPYENKINVSKVNNIVLSEYGNRGHAIMNLIQKPKKKKPFNQLSP